VVNGANPVTALPRDLASKMFLKKVQTWESGLAVAPVDREQGSPVRAAFSKAVHGKPVSAVVSYWQQQIFSGREVPPPERTSDAAVIAFVRANPGAIGYVSGPPPADVKVIAVH
jgi:ABC-type phosphate transport system substrate-binding protein